MTRHLNIISFNPYFTGLPILINQVVTQQNINKKFQSLFYWITYSYGTNVGVGRPCLPKFQSLFYWITYSYLFISCSSSLSSDVSILILLDYLFLFFMMKLTTLDIRMFQSLFYWITYSYVWR